MGVSQKVPPNWRTAKIKFQARNVGSVTTREDSAAEANWDGYFIYIPLADEKTVLYNNHILTGAVIADVL